jgi:hypothetical protein
MWRGHFVIKHVKYNQGGICKAVFVYVSEKIVKTLEIHWYKWRPYHIESLSAVPKQNGGHQCVKIFIKMLNEYFNKDTNE